MLPTDCQLNPKKNVAPRKLSAFTARGILNGYKGNENGNGDQPAACFQPAAFLSAFGRFSHISAHFSPVFFYFFSPATLSSGVGPERTKLSPPPSWFATLCISRKLPAILNVFPPQQCCLLLEKATSLRLLLTHVCINVYLTQTLSDVRGGRRDVGSPPEPAVGP